MTTVTAGIGHNNPPAGETGILKALSARVRKLGRLGTIWLQKPLTDDEAAGKLNDFLAEIRGLAKEAETARKKAKEPHLKAGKDIDARFKAVLTPLDTLTDALKKPLAEYAAEKQRRLDEEQRRAQQEARRQQQLAERQLLKAEKRGDAIAITEAEFVAKTAEAAAVKADKPVRANIAAASTGGRTMSTHLHYRAAITEPATAFTWLTGHPGHGPTLIAEMERLMTAERRFTGSKDLPGVKWIEELRIA